MDMVSNAADGNGVAFQILQDAGLVCPKPFADGGCDKSPPIFGGENDVGG